MPAVTIELRHQLAGRLTRNIHFLLPIYINVTFPKYPGWYLSKFILWWCIPPALPRPPGCFLCLPEIIIPYELPPSFDTITNTQRHEHQPIRPWPWLTCPLNFLVFFLCVDLNRKILHISNVNNFTTFTSKINHYNPTGHYYDSSTNHVENY